MAAFTSLLHTFPFFNVPRRIITRLRRLHPPVILFIHAAPTQCLRTLADAAKPSQNRLHLRDLFAEGRRYYIQPTKEGFRMTSNSRLLWGKQRERSSFAATLYGTFSTPSEQITTIQLHIKSNWLYELRGLFVPAW